eukprot:TRINITY_DN12802_c0_g1_i2.p1 TRINITY_DN12802_c0_g1~~TRINITY_DN12802_c0_g1_i2.p1  ORF type:complete len:232 (-),score=67.89 TRINITY_DN12802_c0_g1_i2:59-754(-)
MKIAAVQAKQDQIKKEWQESVDAKNAELDEENKQMLARIRSNQPRSGDISDFDLEIEHDSIEEEEDEHHSGLQICGGSRHKAHKHKRYRKFFVVVWERQSWDKHTATWGENSKMYRWGDLHGTRKYGDEYDEIPQVSLPEGYSWEPKASWSAASDWEFNVSFTKGDWKNKASEVDWVQGRPKEFDTAVHQTPQFKKRRKKWVRPARHVELIECVEENKPGRGCGKGGCVLS